jgi:hypothetical protein
MVGLGGDGVGAESVGKRRVCLGCGRWQDMGASLTRLWSNRLKVCGRIQG